MGEGDEVGGVVGEGEDDAGAGVGEGGVVAALEQEVAEGRVAAGEDGEGVDGLALGGGRVAAQLVEGDGGGPGLAVVTDVDRGTGLDEHLDRAAGRGRGGGWCGATAGREQKAYPAHQPHHHGEGWVSGGGASDSRSWGRSSPHIPVRRYLVVRLRLGVNIAKVRRKEQWSGLVKFW